MSIVVDFSFAHASVTPAKLKGLDGCIGGIAYAGCNDTSKCITKAELTALLDAGFSMGLVIENGEQDVLGGAPVGTAQGKAIVAAAKTLGYDWQNCVLFSGADFNENTTTQYKKTLASMEAFAKIVPVPGYYGDSDSIDYLYSKHKDWWYWQSDSTSFSPKNPTKNAALLQRYNDSRLPKNLKSLVDVNDLLKTDLPLMGDLPMDQATFDKLMDSYLSMKGGKFTHTINGKKSTTTLVNFAANADNQATAANKNSKAASTSAAAALKQSQANAAAIAALAKAVAQLAPSAAAAASIQQIADQLEISVKK